MRSELFVLHGNTHQDMALLANVGYERHTSMVQQIKRTYLQEDLRSQAQASNNDAGPRTFEPHDDSHLEAALLAKEKVISELHAELHKLETALAEEKEERLAEIRKLHVSLDEKVSACVLPSDGFHEMFKRCCLELVLFPFLQRMASWEVVEPDSQAGGIAGREERERLVQIEKVHVWLNGKMVHVIST